MATDNVTPIRSAQPPTVRIPESLLDTQRSEIYKALAILTITANDLPDELTDHRLALLVACDMLSAVNAELDGAMLASAAKGRSHD